MPDLLIEIGTEEIPARFLPEMEKNIRELVTDEMSAERIRYERIEVFSTYRRLVIRGQAVAPRQEDLVTEIKGPPARVAYDESGNLTKAAQGFAASQKVAVGDLFVRDNYVYAKVHRKGQPTVTVLPDMISGILQRLHLPIAMRWGYEQQSFIRPVHWIVFLWDNEVVPFTFAGVRSGRTTRGHRIFSTRDKRGWAADIEIPAIGDYEHILSREQVLVDPTRRKSLILEQLQRQTEERGITPVIDDELVSEVTYLTEVPTVIEATFPEEFLEVPQQVLITTMQKNQKYFPARSGEQLSNFYYIIADSPKEENSKRIVEGNNRVLIARLKDAKFFYDEDRSVPPEDLIPKLKSIVFQEKLGTLYEKVERDYLLASWLNERVFNGEYPEPLVREAVLLMKTDLVTHMVYEFPQLQGVMGRIYARHAGKKPEVADAIFEHYLPRYTGDQLPDTHLGMICSIADKIDSIAGCFGIGLIPSGSSDPYALRRAAQGIVQIITEKELPLKLDELIEKASAPCGGRATESVAEFFAQRIRTLYIDQGYGYDLVDAVLAVEKSSIPDVKVRLQVLDHKKKMPEFKQFAEAAVRAGRISGEAGKELHPALFEQDEEKALFGHLEVVKAKNEAAGNDYEAIYETCATLVPYIARFFDTVMVMVDDERVRDNRRALLCQVHREFSRLAEFEHIVL